MPHPLVTRRAEAPQILSDLVDDDHRGRITEHLQPDLLPATRPSLVARGHQLPRGRAELPGDLTPQRPRRNAVVAGQAIDRIQSVAHDSGDLARRRQQVGVHELGDVGRPGTGREMPQRDQPMGLAAAEAGLVAVDGVLGPRRDARPAREPGERPGQQIAQALRGERQLEEPLGIGVRLVARGAANHLVELRREVLVHQPARQHVGARHARLPNRRQLAHAPHTTPRLRRIPPPNHRRPISLNTTRRLRQVIPRELHQMCPKHQPTDDPDLVRAQSRRPASAELRLYSPIIILSPHAKTGGERGTAPACSAYPGEGQGSAR